MRRTAQPFAAGLLQQRAVVDRNKGGDGIGTVGERLLVVACTPVGDLLRTDWLPGRAHRRRADDVHSVVAKGSNQLRLELRHAPPVCREYDLRSRLLHDLP